MWRSNWQLPTSATLSPSLVSKIWCIASRARQLAGGDELQMTRRLTVASGLRTQLCVNVIKYWTCFYYYSLLCANLNFQRERQQKWRINHRNSFSLKSHQTVRSWFWFLWSDGLLFFPNVALQVIARLASSKDNMRRSSARTDGRSISDIQRGALGEGLSHYPAKCSSQRHFQNSTEFSLIMWQNRQFSCMTDK